MAAMGMRKIQEATDYRYSLHLRQSSSIFGMQEEKMYFSKLEDSPMFRQQVQCMEESAESLRERSLKFYKGCRKYIDGLVEGYDRDIAFAGSLETFGGGQSDPVCVSFGGPDMNKFALALREIGTYKEILRAQVENILNDRLVHFVNVELQDVKDARKRFDKADMIFDQAREKFLSLRKSARLDIATAIEEELHNARSAFEEARFNLVKSLSAVEAKKRFELLEAVGVTMNAHLRYFKQGYELLHQMEPYINQILDYAQQSKEIFNYEQVSLSKRMQDYQKKVDEESISCPVNAIPAAKGDVPIQVQNYPRSSHKAIQAVMQTATEGKVQTIKQGYLSKRSSNLRADWKRRFFVLDNRGMLYYYRKQCARPVDPGNPKPSHRSTPSEPSQGLLSRWLSSHYHDEKPVARHTVNLLTSTIKVDADQIDLRFCFRIISPTKNYALQAESAADQMDWIEKITGVIASLLSSQTSERHNSPLTSESISRGSLSSNNLIKGIEDQKELGVRKVRSRSSQHLHYSTKTEKPVDALKRLAGNEKCVDCGSPEPDWASLNLGVLICIECSGAHRNLGVHISKVRSLALDVKVWEPSVIAMFLALGNVFVNSVWEELLNSRKDLQADELSANLLEPGKPKQLYKKPDRDDHISVKEKFIQAKYAEKRYVEKVKDKERVVSVAQQLWESVRVNDKKAVYRLIVVSEADVNAIRSQCSTSTSLTLASVMRLQEQHADPDSDTCQKSAEPFSGGGTEDYHRRHNTNSKTKRAALDDYGCSLLHLACQTADIAMVELLLQHGANINASDARGQTPLHHSIIRGRSAISKLLLARGANAAAVDEDGKTPIQLVSESGLDDVEYLPLVKNHK